MAPVMTQNWNIRNALFSVMFNQYQSCLKSSFSIEITTMKNMDNLHGEWKPSCATTKSTHFAVNKDKWHTKEDSGKFNGKFIKNVIVAPWLSWW